MFTKVAVLADAIGSRITSLGVERVRAIDVHPFWERAGLPRFELVDPHRLAWHSVVSGEFFRTVVGGILGVGEDIYRRVWGRAFSHDRLLEGAITERMILTEPFHGRPAALLIRLLKEFASDETRLLIRREPSRVPILISPDSIISLMLMGLRKGENVELVCMGPRHRQLLARLIQYNDGAWQAHRTSGLQPPALFRISALDEHVIASRIFDVMETLDTTMLSAIYHIRRQEFVVGSSVVDHADMAIMAYPPEERSWDDMVRLVFERSDHVIRAVIPRTQCQDATVAQPSMEGVLRRQFSQLFQGIPV